MTMARASADVLPVRGTLHELHRAETAFLAKHKTYASDLRAIGFTAGDDDGWTYGFCNEFPSEPVIEPDPLDATPNLRLGSLLHILEEVEDPCPRLADLGLADQFRVSATAFKAFAIGTGATRPPGKEYPPLEIWSVDSSGNIEFVARWE